MELLKFLFHLFGLRAFNKIVPSQDGFPGGPEVRAPRFHFSGCSSTPDRGAKIHMPSGQKQKLAKVSFLRIESFTFFVMVLLLLLFKPTLGLP